MLKNQFSLHILLLFLHFHNFLLRMPLQQLILLLFQCRLPENKFKEQLDELASDYEFINIDLTHEDIIDNDVDKVLKYLK